MKIKNLIIIMGVSIANIFAIDTLYCIANYEFQTPMAEIEFVKTIALGDINADGYDDWSLLFRDFNEFQKDDSVWIFLGNDTIDFTPDYKFRANDIASLGDVNRDGYQDIGYLDVRTWGDVYIYKPKLYVLYGGPDFDLVPDDSCIVYGEGYKVTLSPIGTIGDINHDGYNDIYCGVSNKWNEWNGAKQYIYLGGESLSASPDIVIYPPGRIDLTTEAYNFGWCSSPIMDINADGFDDFILMFAKGIFTSNHDTVYVHVYYGSSDPDCFMQSNDILISGYRYYRFLTTTNLDAQSEYAILLYKALYSLDIFSIQDTLPLLHFDNVKETNTGSGDINNDGFSDFFIHFADPDFYRGYYGGLNLDSDFDVVLPANQQPATHFEKQVSSSIIGNICGDGFDKLLVIESDREHNEYTYNPDLKYHVYCYSYNEVETKIKEINLNVPETTLLLNVYPNPFNPSITLQYNLPIQSDVECSIYDIAGNLVEEIEFHQNSGTYSFVWNGSETPSGIYLIRFVAKATDGSKIFVDYQKVTLLK